MPTEYKKGLDAVFKSYEDKDGGAAWTDIDLFFRDSDAEKMDPVVFSVISVLFDMYNVLLKHRLKKIGIRDETYELCSDEDSSSIGLRQFGDIYFYYSNNLSYEDRIQLFIDSMLNRLICIDDYSKLMRFYRELDENWTEESLKEFSNEVAEGMGRHLSKASKELIALKKAIHENGGYRYSKHCHKAAY